ncbi:CPBP family glutamic-type intramembrane protease [Sphingosinicella rhizophila]|uniref:CPBP family glutamic-type intramembrane protease n=1 Tax=Sphingosinicella rhizophila TaxID=3050082 RepID=A0ABU3Q5Y5_9SPHN|nr:CPBP family glutamic-type intramembrane protease [Sphingosinicella sp. GR2756]MDT9598821.1 CPBP family glutamic-type intramembrane protease [Sphingosinicella sp. GR2756]
MTERPARSILPTFFALTIAFCALPWALIIYSGDVGGGGAGYVYALMWGPGLAAIATIWLKKRDIGLLGLGWGRSRYPLLGYLIPIGYSAVAYILIWLTGLGGFPNMENIGKLAAGLGWGITDPALFIPLFILFIGTTSMLTGIASGLGEEIGWRGFMAPQLVQRFGFTSAGLLGGLVWAAWHFPLILFANYNFGAPAWYSIFCFTIMVTFVGFIMQWLRLESGSVWPAAIMHGSHNVFIQTIFTPLTFARGDQTAYAIDEFGFMLPIVTGVVAFYLWTKRDHAVAAMNERIARTGNP